MQPTLIRDHRTIRWHNHDRKTSLVGPASIKCCSIFIEFFLLRAVCSITQCWRWIGRKRNVKSEFYVHITNHNIFIYGFGLWRINHTMLDCPSHHLQLPTSKHRLWMSNDSSSSNVNYKMFKLLLMRLNAIIHELLRQSTEWVSLWCCCGVADDLNGSPNWNHQTGSCNNFFNYFLSFIHLGASVIISSDKCAPFISCQILSIHTKHAW